MAMTLPRTHKGRSGGRPHSPPRWKKVLRLSKNNPRQPPSLCSPLPLAGEGPGVRAPRQRPAPSSGHDPHLPNGGLAGKCVYCGVDGLTVKRKMMKQSLRHRRHENSGDRAAWLKIPATSLPSRRESFPSRGESFTFRGEKLPRRRERLTSRGERLLWRGGSFPSRGESFPFRGEKLPW